MTHTNHYQYSGNISSRHSRRNHCEITKEYFPDTTYNDYIVAYGLTLLFISPSLSVINLMSEKDRNKTKVLTTKDLQKVNQEIYTDLSRTQLIHILLKQMLQRIKNNRSEQ